MPTRERCLLPPRLSVWYSSWRRRVLHGPWSMHRFCLCSLIDTTTSIIRAGDLLLAAVGCEVKPHRQTLLDRDGIRPTVLARGLLMVGKKTAALLGTPTLVPVFVHPRLTTIARSLVRLLWPFYGEPRFWHISSRGIRELSGLCRLRTILLVQFGRHRSGWEQCAEREQGVYKSRGCNKRARMWVSRTFGTKTTRVSVFGKVRSKVYRGYSICSVNTLRVQKSSVMFGTNSITVPNASIRSVRNTCTRHFDEFGATSIPVPDTSVSSVRPRYRYPILW